ncbi:hypothetical protein JW968_00865 [Candidatus Woesearchaeota archaeon]|nr:hypothetical protein [Candidatus Woesearchaeota archaeon]
MEFDIYRIEEGMLTAQNAWIKALERINRKRRDKDAIRPISEWLFSLGPDAHYERVSVLDERGASARVFRSRLVNGTESLEQIQFVEKLYTFNKLREMESHWKKSFEMITTLDDTIQSLEGAQDHDSIIELVRKKYQRREQARERQATEKDFNFLWNLFVQQLGVFLGTSVDLGLKGIAVPAETYAINGETLSVYQNMYSTTFQDYIGRMEDDMQGLTLKQWLRMKETRQTGDYQLMPVRGELDMDPSSERVYEIALLTLGAAELVAARVRAGWKDRDWKLLNTVLIPQHTGDRWEYRIALIDQASWSPYGELYSMLTPSEKCLIYPSESPDVVEMTIRAAPTRRILGAVGTFWHNWELPRIMTEHLKDWQEKTGYHRWTFATELDDPQMLASEFLSMLGLYEDIFQQNPVLQAKEYCTRRAQFIIGEYALDVPEPLQPLIPLFRKAILGRHDYTAEKFLADIKDACNKILPDGINDDNYSFRDGVLRYNK